MIISFWSTHHGQPATTTNMLSIGLCSALQHKMRVLLVSAQSADSHLRDYLLPEYKVGVSRDRRSADDLMRLARNGLLQAPSLANYTTPILKSSLLDVLSGMSLEQTDEAEIDVFKMVLQMAKDTYDVIFIDVHSGLNKHYVASILDYSDAVVYNVSQNIESIEATRQVLRGQFNHHHQFACIGNFEKGCKLTAKQIAKLLSVDDVLSIPRHASLIDVINTGNVLEYFGRFFYKGKFDQQHPFFGAVIKSTDTLLKRCELNR